MNKNCIGLLVGCVLGVLMLPGKVLAAPVIGPASAATSADIPKYEKFEASFAISNTVATKYNWPYEASPPAGIPSGTGITVNVLFTPDSWQTTYTQPAFYYVGFLDEIRSNREWFYPSGQNVWKVRFSPHLIGLWKYKISVEDAGGITESQEYSFNTVESSSPGFIKVSKNDPRYFEFDNGTYFPGLGYNMNYDHVQWINPVLGNRDNFAIMGANNNQLVRLWLSQWSIFGSAWNPWYGIRGDYDNYVPRNGFITYGFPGTDATPSSQLALVYSETNGVQNNGSWFDACRFLGGFQAKPAVKRNTNYEISIRYRATNLTGPRVEDTVNFPNRDNFGLVAKVQNPADGHWYSTDHPNDYFCWNYSSNNTNTGIRLTPYGQNSSDWTMLRGQWNSGNNDFLPIFYLALENVNPGNRDTGVANPYVYIDTVEIKDADGINVVTKPSMEQLFYFMERNAYAFDKVVDLAHQNNIYLRPVVLEKNEQIQNEIGADGSRAAFSNNNFYGNWESRTAVRWLQTTWWRYLQARWGYSPNIHSWELLNEGDPASSRHSTLADEMAKYMHQFGPNSHLVSTSNWHSFPAAFWADCPNCDFTDYHRYIDKATNSNYFYDTALATFDNSNSVYQTSVTNNFNKPIIRGETGLTDSGTEPGTTEVVCRDRNGLWLHNFIWAGLNRTGVMESYWYENLHIFTNALYDCDNNSVTPRERITYDFRPYYKYYYNFVAGIPLNNGNYVNAGAVTSETNLRAWGQKDLTNQKAHLWISNAMNTWRNVADGVSNPGINGNIQISGFTPNRAFSAEWWNTYNGTVARTESILSNSDGVISLSVADLVTDSAVKVFPSATATPKPGDANNDQSVDGIDYVIWLTYFGNTTQGGAANGDFNSDSYVDGIDYVIWLNNYDN